MIAFGEEFLFRGYLQNRLIAWRGQLQGLVLTALIFSYSHIVHRMLVEELTFPDAFLASTALLPVGLLMGFVMLRTGNLVTVVLFHTFVNFVNTLK